jgi:hypothetical protein
VVSAGLKVLNWRDPLLLYSTIVHFFVINCYSFCGIARSSRRIFTFRVKRPDRNLIGGPRAEDWRFYSPI